MGVSDEAYAGRERRQERNADLRALFYEIGDKVTDNSKLTEDDMSQVRYLLRVYYWRDLGSRPPSYLLDIVREEHADELSPAMLALLDEVMGRSGGAL